MKRRVISPGRNERPASYCYRCRLPGCRRLVGLSDNGYPLALCKPHAEQLPDGLYEDLEEAAGGAVCDPKQVLAAAKVVVRIKEHFGPAPRKAKRKP